MKDKLKSLSKLISYWLRHSPEDANLQVDEFGWVALEKLQSALEARGYIISIDQLLELNRSFDKVRWEIDHIKQRIKATHGHSIPVSLDSTPETPPEILYHGTAVQFLTRIIEKGLLPMNRQFVHLSETKGIALEVGSRHGNPFMIAIGTKELLDKGWKFYKTSENVWLTASIPSDYLSFIPWHKVETEQTKTLFLGELKKEIDKNHFLYNQLSDLELVWRQYACDDTLFRNNKTGKHFLIHLTWKGKTEVEVHQSVDNYDTFQDWVTRGLSRDNQECIHGLTLYTKKQEMKK